MRIAPWAVLGLVLLSGACGCGGVTEKDKEAAEKVPSLEINEGENTTSDSAAEEKKESDVSEKPK